MLTEFCRVALRENGVVSPGQSGVCLAGFSVDHCVKTPKISVHEVLVTNI